MSEQSSVSSEQARESLLLLRRLLFGLSEIERGRGEVTEQEAEGIRALAGETVRDNLVLLDLYLTGNVTQRSGDDDLIDVLKTPGRHEQLKIPLSDLAHTKLLVHKPTAEDIQKRRGFVKLDTSGPYDPDTLDGWRRIDSNLTRPDADLLLSGEAIFKMSLRSR